MSIFQTDAWQRAWWETWGADNGLELLRPWGEGGTGIYRSRYLVKGCLPLRSIEFVGGSYRKFRSTRTEYNAFCSINETPTVAIAALNRLMDSHPWGEAVFSDLLSNSEEVAELFALARKKRWMIREAATDTAWQVHTDGSFEAYLATLGKNTRLRLYNRRKVLESLGDINHQDIYEVDQDPREFFFRLNSFHLQRWGKPAYGEKALAFNVAFLEKVGREGGKPQLLELRVGEKLVSLLYNVKYQGRIYNLQNGFEENFHPKLAVGTLHLGYAIERAFQDVDVQFFDMLAGSGKNEDYKQRLANHSEPLISLMLIKHPVLKLLYGLKDIS